MSRLQRLKQRAARAGVYVYKEGSGWNVLVDAEWLLGPRELQWSKRQAIHQAHQISISKKLRLEITTS